eukprot:354782-Chlamydomonas_euryale.AAC.7
MLDGAGAVTCCLNSQPFQPLTHACQNRVHYRWLQICRSCGRGTRCTVGLPRKATATEQMALEAALFITDMPGESSGPVCSVFGCAGGALLKPRSTAQVDALLDQGM